MKPNTFSSLEEMGVVSFRRLFQPIRSEKILVLGHDPEKPQTLEIWQGLLKGAVQSNVKIQKMYHYTSGQETLPEYFAQFNPIPLDLDQLQSVRDELVKSRKRHGLTIFIVPTELATHLREDSLTKKMEVLPLGPVLSFSQIRLVLDPEELDRISSSCTELDPSDLKSRLECIEFRYTKSQWRKKLDPEKILGAIERYGLKEYLLFVHQP